MPDFQDITPVVVCFETDIGAVGALMDDPILNKRADIEDDKSSYYLNARLRGVDHLRKAITDGPSFITIVAAAGLSYCDHCHAEPEEPCVNEDATATVPMHRVRIDNVIRVAKEIQDHYMAEDVKLDGPHES